MAEEILVHDLKHDIVTLKNHDERRFGFLTRNFYLMKAALRYFAVKKNQSVTSQRVAENFPVTIPAAGSSLKMLEELGVVEDRNTESSANRYMPSKIDFNRLEKIEQILVDSYEIKSFEG